MNINSTMKNDDVMTENILIPSSPSSLSSSNPSVHLFLCRLLQEPRNGGQDQRGNDHHDPSCIAATATAENDAVVSVDMEKMIKCEVEWSHSLSQIDDDISDNSASLSPSLHSMLTQEIIEPTLSLLLPPPSSSSNTNSNSKSNATDKAANSYSYSLHGYKYPTLTFQILSTIRMAVILLHHNQTQCAAVALTRLTQCITNSIHIADKSNSETKSMSELKSNSKEEDKITVPVRLFLHLCLRILEPLCSLRRGANQCCAVTWRGITTIATTAVSSTASCANNNVTHHHVSIDEDIVKRAISRLVHLLAEGWEGIRTMTPPPVPIRNQNSNQHQHQHQQDDHDQMQMQRYKMELGNRNKLLKFFAMRLVQLSPLLSTSSPSSSSILGGALQGGAQKEEEGSHAKITVQDILESLITLRGSVAYIEIEQQRMQSIDSVGVGVGAGIDSKAMKGLSSKLDECLECFMLNLCDKALHHDTTNAFLTCCTHSEKKRNGRRRKYVHFHLGALICAMHILEKAVLVHEDEVGGDDDAQHLLALCELILFHIVPHCHAHLVSVSMKNTNKSVNTNINVGLDRILKIILKTLLRINVQPHVMIRWLAGNVHPPDTSKPNSTTSTSTLVHPLTMELVLGIAHTYIIRCGRKRRYNHGVSENIGGGGGGGSVGNHRRQRNRNRNDLVRIMAKMVFDPRVSRIHRRNLGIVLHRLLKMMERGIGSNKIHGKGIGKRKSSVTKIKHTVEAAVARAYLDFLEGLLIQSTGTYQNHVKENQQGGRESRIENGGTTGKHNRGADESCNIDDNRSNSKRYPTVEGLCEILPLIRTISTGPILWSKMSTSTYEALMTMMSKLLSFQSVSSRENDNGKIDFDVDACISGRMDNNSTKRRSKFRSGRRRNALSSQLAKIQLILRDNPDLLQVAITFLSAASTTGASKSTGVSAASESNSTKSQSLKSREQHRQLLEIMTLALSQVHTQMVAGAFRDHNLTLFCFAKDLISSPCTTAKGGPPDVLTPKILESVTTTLKALTSSRKSQTSRKCGCAILLSGMATIIAASAAAPSHASSQGVKSAVTSSFNLLLSNRNTSIVAMTMSSLEEFAKKVSDRRMIPGCVPPESQSLLQARLKYEIYCSSSRTSIVVTPEQFFYWRSKEGEKLVISSKTKRHFFPGLLLPSTKFPMCISFEVGSQILQINDPTDKTKRGFVIIPPQNRNVVNLTDISTWEVGKEGRVMRVDSLQRGRRCNISTG